MGLYRVRRLKIVIPFVQRGLAPETKAWGEEYKAEFVDLTGDDEGYFKLMSRLLSEGDEFYIVEQDMLPDAQQFIDMAACQREWCAGVHKTHDDAAEQWSLGLMKFSNKLLARRFNLGYDGNTAPDAAEVLAQVLGPGRGLDGSATPPDRRWFRVDLALWTVIGMATAPRSETLNPHLLGVEPLDARAPDGSLQPHLHRGPARHLHHEMEQRRLYA